MSRYTDIDILLNQYQTICCGVACMDCPFNDEGCRLEKMLLGSPIADVVPVVRCKDCKYSESTTDLHGEPYPFLICTFASMAVEHNDYCSKGSNEPFDDDEEDTDEVTE